MTTCDSWPTPPVITTAVLFTATMQLSYVGRGKVSRFSVRHRFGLRVESTSIEFSGLRQGSIQMVKLHRSKLS